jgi:SAM-dependent methyltransferase
MHEHSHHDPAASHHLDFESPQMAAHAELEAEVFIDLISDALAVLADLCARDGLDVRRVLDIGSGPGVGTCHLAEQFSSARVVAVDGSATMLHHVAARAARLGLAARIETRQADLAAEIPTLGQADVVWASMALHHVGDEAAALGELRKLLRPVGHLALVELGEPLRVLGHDADLGRPGLWERLDAASAKWFADMRAELPGTTTSTDYPTMIAAAGFELVVDDELTVVLDAPLDARARQFAHRHLRQTRSRLASHAADHDLEVLDELLDEKSERSILHRDDIEMRASRHLYVARS